MDNKNMAQIVVDNKSAKTDRFYSYLIPKEYENKVKIGTRVLVPFGRGNKLLEGIIINITNNTTLGKIKFKYIDTILDKNPILSKNMVELGLWMKEKYLAQYIDIFRTIMPTGISSKVCKHIELKENISSEILIDIKSVNQKRIIKFLLENKESNLDIISKQLNIKNILTSIRALKEKQIIRVYDVIETNVRKKFEKVVCRNFNIELKNQILNELSSNAIKQKEIIDFISKYDSVSLKRLMMETSSSLSSVKSVQKKDFIKIIEMEVKRNPISKEIQHSDKMTLTNQQKKCVETIFFEIKKFASSKFLIHGVTGSGKTEIYMQIIEKVLQSGKQSIVLVPEISLTPQTVERFVGRFGEKVAVLHSKLSLGERYDEWRRIKEGEVQIAVGARSAVFAPFDNLGLIVIDEEHETSYKSSMSPRYDTIEVAEKRCQLEGAALVLGSATPSIDTYYKATLGEIKLLQLTERINKKPLPEIEVVDMKQELDKGNKTIFSESLLSAMEENLKNKEQTILFLNRRGFSTFVSCRKCGYVEKCKECDISLTYHLSENILKCHYCGSTKEPPKICPECGSNYIKYFGIGTQRIEEIVKRTFPNARVERMDVDTTSRKGSHEEIFSKVKRGEVDILIGTQMITKGLDFPNVTLVGIIAADTSLNLPDYKASERTFQLTTQVSGRAGRGRIEGRVILQTYEPEHYSIVTAKKHDYISFYKKEIKLREGLGYPPFTNIINILMTSKDEKKLYRFSNKISYSIKNDIKKEINNSIILLGPNPAPLSKIKGNYRWQIIIKCKDFLLDGIKSIINERCSSYLTDEKNNDIRLSIDINPNSTM